MTTARENMGRHPFCLESATPALRGPLRNRPQSSGPQARPLLHHTLCGAGTAPDGTTGKGICEVCVLEATRGALRLFVLQGPCAPPWFTVWDCEGVSHMAGVVHRKDWPARDTGVRAFLIPQVSLFPGQMPRAKGTLMGTQDFALMSPCRGCGERPHLTALPRAQILISLNLPNLKHAWSSYKRFCSGAES